LLVLEGHPNSPLPKTGPKITQVFFRCFRLHFPAHNINKAYFHWVNPPPII